MIPSAAAAAAAERTFRAESGRIVATADPRVRRLRSGRGRDAGRPRRCHGALAPRRHAGQPGGVDHHRRQAQGDRPPAAGPARHREAPAAWPPGRPDRRGRRDARWARPPRADRRPAAPDLHLLPSRAQAGGTGGADPAHTRRPHDAGDRVRVPGTGADHGATAGSRQAQDTCRQHPVPGAAGPSPSGAPGGGARRDLSRVQRGLRGD